MKYLRHNENEPSDTDWDTVSVLSFKMPAGKFVMNGFTSVPFLHYSKGKNIFRTF